MLFHVAGIVQVYRKYEKLESFLVSIDNDVAAVTRQKNFDGMCSNDHNDELVLFWFCLLFQTLILSMHLITVCYDNSNVFFISITDITKTMLFYQTKKYVVIDAHFMN